MDEEKGARAMFKDGGRGEWRPQKKALSSVLAGPPGWTKTDHKHRITKNTSFSSSPPFEPQ